VPADNILLLPGMMCDARLWEPQSHAFEQPVFYADTTQADNIHDMATQVLAEAPQQFAIAGLSMGGILAFEIWRQSPERVTHMALLDTNPRAEIAARQSLRMQQIQTALSGGLRELAIEALKPVYLAETHRDDRELLTKILDMVIDLGPEVFRTQSLALRDRPNSVPTLTTIDCPALIMCGAEDSICPVEYHEFMAERIPNARLRVIDDCGHMSSLEQPDVVASELRQLFQQ
jgi:pimeloyl-ACP methyl ester carboxylesterase